MSATCAICERPIRARAELVVSGFEVVHRDCAKTGRKTMYWRLREEVARIAADYASNVRAIADIDQRRRDDHDRQALTHITAVLRQLEVERQAKEALSAALLAARRETERLRAELVNAQRRPAQPVTEAAPDPVVEVEDATAVRFSMLELD